MKKTYSNFQRCTSFLLALILTVTLLPTLGTRASAANTSKADVVFSVPEAIYLKPDVASYTTQSQYDFQYYVDSEIDPVTHQAKLRTGENFTGNIYFYYPDVDPYSCWLSFRYLNSDGTEMAVPDPDSSAPLDPNQNYAPTGYCMQDKNYSLATKNNREGLDKSYLLHINADHSGSLDLRFGNSPTLAASETGCFIEWTLSYRDSTDGKTYEAKAYTYVYKPMVQPVGVGVRCMNAYYDDMWTSQLSWVSGVHSIENTGTYYPKSSGGDGSLVPFSSRASYGYCPDRSDLNFQFGSNILANSYMDWLTDDENPKHWLTTDGNGLFRVKSFHYASDSNLNSGTVLSSMQAYVYVTSPIASLNVDSSRYRNFDQIPNLSVGLLATDNEGSESGFYMVRNWHEEPDRLDVDGSAVSATSDYWTGGKWSYWEKVDVSGGYRISVSKDYPMGPGDDTDYKDGLKYNGKWTRDFASTGSKTGRYDVIGVFFNYDDESLYYGTDSSMAIGRVRVAVYMNDKSALRNAVNTVISASARLGLTTDNGSNFYDTGSAEWNTLMEAYKGASLMLTALDYVPEITVNGETYSDPDSMALALNTALNAVLNSGAAENIPDNRFTDVPTGAWYEEAVAWAAETGVTKGASETTFSPNENATRAQFVTMLYRMAGSPDSEYTNKFRDVPAGAYYEKAVVWANGLGIVAGIGGGKYAPNQAITREQMVTMLYRLASLEETPKAYDASLLESYSDKDSISDWAKNTVQWAVGEKIMVGSDGELYPGKNATRAEIVTVLYAWSKQS